MPDLRPAEQFRKGMLYEERRFRSAVARAMRDRRAVMQDVVLSMGVKNPSLMASLEPQFQAVARQVQQAAAERAPEIVSRMGSFTERQFGLLRRAIGSAPTLGEASAFAAGEVAAIEQAFTAVPGWIGVWRGRTAAAARQLRDEDVEVAARRLFSLQMVDGRASVFRHAANTAQTESGLMIWGAATLIGDAFLQGGREATGIDYQRQAIAAVDERTTDCCLRVHGQIVGVDEQFRLTGTPKFSDTKKNPPFHWNCRTGTSLYVEDFEDFGVTTGEMREAAQTELQAREITGRREEIHPAHATSGRGG